MLLLRLAVVWIIFLPAMSQQSNDEHLRMLFSQGYAPTRRRRSTIGARTPCHAQVTVEQGKEVFEYAQLHLGPAFMETCIVHGTLRLPAGFWPRFFKDCLNRVKTRALYKTYRKALSQHLRSLKVGAITKCGKLGDKRRDQHRALGGELNSLKCPELGQLLYTWFIDCVQILRTRTDACLIMTHARWLRARFVAESYDCLLYTSPSPRDS